MKKQILGIALVAAIVGSITIGCSSQKKSGTSDTSMKDTTKVATPAPTPVDTTKKDTIKKDTTHH